MNPKEVLSNPAAQALLLAAINKRLTNIENAVGGRKVIFLAEDAVAAYKKHLREGVSRRGTRHRKPWNFDYLLDAFLEEFTGQNMADITPEALDAFVDKFWHNAKSGTVKQRQTQLRIFFNWSIRHLKKKGKPTFPSPCELLEPVHHEVERPAFMTVNRMRLVLSRLQQRGNIIERIAFEILLTAGIRISELLKLTRSDVNGRILRLRSPKSGQRVEYAVIPKKLAKLLNDHIYVAMEDDAEPVIPVSEKTVFNIIKDNTRQEMSPHDLRKWVASYWERKGEEGMVNFVLRHSALSLKGRYVAPLSTKEAMDKQDAMEEELYES